jgi:8-hydroxy-5-deazaflavin:NADPH oxidoreductase
MKIGIIGSGEVGRRLGKGCIDLGYYVMIGTRDPKKKKSNHGYKIQQTKIRPL